MQVRNVKEEQRRRGVAVPMLRLTSALPEDVGRRLALEAAVAALLVQAERRALVQEDEGVVVEAEEEDKEEGRKVTMDTSTAGGKKECKCSGVHLRA